MTLARVRVPLAPFKRAFRDDEQAKVPWWLAALLIAVCIAGGMLRIGFTMSFDSVWAEDGTIFLSAAMKDGLADSILQPYAGYGHVVPRFLAALASAAPTWAIPATLSIEAAAVCGLLAVLVFRAVAGLVPITWLRLSLALFVALQPIAGEVLLSIANLQWYFLFASFVALLWSATTTSAIIASTSVCFLAAVSSPFGAVLIPLAILRVVLLPSARAAAASVALFVGVIIQAAIMVSAPARELRPLESPARVGGWYLGHVVGATIFGDRLSGGAMPARALVFGFAGVGLMVWLWFSLGRTARSAVWPALLLITVFSLTLYFSLTATAGLAAPRYAVPPGLCLALALAIMLNSALRERPSGRLNAHERMTRVPIVLTCAAVLIGWVIALPAVRESRVRWSESLRIGVDICAEASVHEAEVPITPSGWTALLPCADLPSR